jgi:hypothetical protein
LNINYEIPRNFVHNAAKVEKLFQIKALLEAELRSEENEV